MNILAYLNTIILFILGEKNCPLFIKKRGLGFVPCDLQSIRNKSTSINSYNRFPSVYLRGEFDLHCMLYSKFTFLLNFPESKSGD